MFGGNNDDYDTHFKELWDVDRLCLAHGLVYLAGLWVSHGVLQRLAALN